MEQIVKLSILICHLPERQKEIDRLLGILHKQDQSNVEILINETDCSVGMKRNKLLSNAKGAYVSFIDDDDEVPEYYISEIIHAIEKEKPDCVGIVGEMRQSIGSFLFKHSIEYVSWYTGADGVFYRTPNHLNPIKRGIAEAIGFDSSMSYGEDRKFSDRVRPHLKTEVYIRDKIMYYYNAKDM